MRILRHEPIRRIPTMDAFLGTWVMIPEKVDNLEAFMDAMKFPEEAKAIMREGTKNGRVTMTKDGSSYTTVSEFGSHKETLTFKLGEPFVSKTLGPEITNLFKMEDDDVVVGEHEMAGKKSSSRRHIDEDGQLVVETTCDGVTSRAFMRRA